MDERSQQSLRRSVISQRLGAQAYEANALAVARAVLETENAELRSLLAVEQNKNTELQTRITAVEQQVNELRATGAAGLRLVGQDDTEAA